MININFYENAFIVDGHANFADIGNDIVCSAISGIIMGSLNWFDEATIRELIVDDKKPIIKIVFSNMPDKNKIGLSLIHHQVSMIERNYDKYIKIKKNSNYL